MTEVTKLKKALFIVIAIISVKFDSNGFEKLNRGEEQENKVMTSTVKNNFSRLKETNDQDTEMDTPVVKITVGQKFFQELQNEPIYQQIIEFNRRWEKYLHFKRKVLNQAIFRIRPKF